MSQFTPGPWVACRDRDGHVIRMGAAIKHPHDHESHLVVRYDHLCTDEDCDAGQIAEAAANAALIASAPALYEALKELLKTVDAQYCSGLRWDPETVEAAKAALAAAEAR